MLNERSARRARKRPVEGRGDSNVSIRLHATIDYLVFRTLTNPMKDDWALAGTEHLPHAMKGT